MSELEWLLRGGSMDASSGVVLPGVHLAERIEALGRRRVLAELQARARERSRREQAEYFDRVNH